MGFPPHLLTFLLPDFPTANPSGEILMSPGSKLGSVDQRALCDSKSCIRAMMTPSALVIGGILRIHLVVNIP